MRVGRRDIGADELGEHEVAKEAGVEWSSDFQASRF
jgi:hypothetical protein